MDLEVVGRHALLFDDDDQAAFVNSSSALVPWGGDPSLVIDRYDARHLLPSIPSKRGGAYVELEVDGVSRSELDGDRYLDLLLLPSGEEGGAEGAPEGVSKGEEAGLGTYQAVPFSYGDSDGSITNSKPDVSLDYSGFRPPFPLPENLLSCLPPTEKLHQIIARTSLFVSKHGGQSEIILRVKQGDNPTFGFLMPSHELHPYFRFLVGHPNLLSSDASINAQTDKSPYGIGDNQSQSAGGALSLLGSVYGSLDEDESILQESSDSKRLEPSNTPTTVAAKQTQQSNKAALHDPIPVSEAKSLASSKESTQTLKKNPPVVPSSSISASGKAKMQTSSVNTIASKAHPSPTGVEKLIVEPPSTMKETIGKLVEFILRNGREFETVLIEQDRPHGRFPFLLPTNLYHAYYVKVLHEAQENKRLGKRPSDQKCDSQRSKDGGRKSREPSGSGTQISASQTEGLYDPERKEKFKMVIGGPKKELSPKPSKEPGVSVDVAAAIVMAATRGLSSPTEVQPPAKPSPISTSTVTAIVMAATRHSTSPNGDSADASVPGQSRHSSSFGSLSALRNGGISISGLLSNPELGTSVPGKISTSTEGKVNGSADSVKVANAIAKNVAIAAASEADSSEASLTKEQKLKAERLKRAKLFTTMIKNGAQDAMKLLPAEIGQIGSNATGPDSALSGSISDHGRKEREGSSMPIDAEVSGKLDKKDSSRRGSKHLSRNDDDDDLEECKHSQRKKCRSETSQSDKEERRHKRHYRSSSRSSRCESSSEDELPHRKRSRSGHRYRRHRGSDDEDDRHRSRSDTHQRRKPRSEGKKEKVKEPMETISEQPDHISTKSAGDTSEGVAPSSVPGSRGDAAEVSDDLRAKVRAMLLATL